MKAGVLSRVARAACAVGGWLLLQQVAWAGPSSLQLSNAVVRLEFDAETGAWLALRDAATGENLLLEGGNPVGPTGGSRAVLDTGAVRSALEAGTAMDLGGEAWRFAPAGGGSNQWRQTAVPGRRGSGDDRLCGQVGVFWYEREVQVPSAWRGKDLALVAGAVDDFDCATFNGGVVGATGAETPRHWEAPRHYRVPASLVQAGATNRVRFCVTNGAGEGGLAGPVVLGLAEALPGPRGSLPALKGVRLDSYEGAQLLRLVAEESPWEYTLDVRLTASEPVFSRQLTIRNITDEEQLLQDVTLVTPPLSPGPAATIGFPGSMPDGERCVEALAAGEPLRPRSEDPLAVLWSEKAGRGVGFWYHCTEEFSPVSVRRVGSGVVVQNQQPIVMRLKPRESVSLGRQYAWIGRGMRREVIGGVQGIYDKVRLSVPTNGLPGLSGMVLYCGHPGGVPERGFRGYGGFKALESYLPTLRRMGVDVLWLLPIWEHGEGVEWNLYAPFDHRRVSGLYGTPEELAALSRRGREQGIRLMFDLVPHGPPDFTPLAKDHPEWVARDAEGGMQRAWGQLAFDNRHPGWQEYMRQAASWGAREFGAAGARVDCAAGGPLNWSREVGNRPSLSGLSAGLGMTQAIRQGYLDAGEKPVVLPEEYTGARVYHRVSDLTYDAQLYFLQMALQAESASPEAWASRIQQFLSDQQAATPPRAILMRWISNHDTVSWTYQKARPAKVYGLPRMRALLALCAFIEGVPMLYQGDEDPEIWGGKGESHVEFLARIYGLRKTLPGLREGKAAYLPIPQGSGVFVMSRGDGADRVVVMISFDPQPSHVPLIDGLGLGEGRWMDRVRDERLTIATQGVAMGPHQVRVLVREH